VLELEERGAERALIERQLIAADLFDPPHDQIPVQRAHRLEGLEDHEAQGAVQAIALSADTGWRSTDEAVGCPQV
jgi:hypothetical protein